MTFYVKEHLLIVFFNAVLFVEFLNASCRIQKLLLSGKERMASRTNFNFQIAGRAAGFKCIAACAGHRDLFVFWMDSFFHFRLPIINLQSHVFYNDKLD
jgi:hypothetical protein